METSKPNFALVKFVKKLSWGNDTFLIKEISEIKIDDPDIQTHFVNFDSQTSDFDDKLVYKVERRKCRLRCSKNHSHLAWSRIVIAVLTGEELNDSK